MVSGLRLSLSADVRITVGVRLLLGFFDYVHKKEQYIKIKIVFQAPSTS